MLSKIILASASPRRAELLKQIGIDFEVVPSHAVEEFEEGIFPDQLVRDLALTKALQVARNFSSGYIIGADTIVVLNGKILGKPNGPSEAAMMLSMLSGAEHSVFTGVAIVGLPDKQQIVNYVETKVKFRQLTEDDIARYIATGEPFDKAGAYGIQGRGAVLVEKINGCYFNVVGLPLAKLIDMFKDFGVFL